MYFGTKGEFMDVIILLLIPMLILGLISFPLGLLIFALFVLILVCL